MQVNNADAAPPAPTRRRRVRAATVTEIKQTARQLLVGSGAAGVSLRAIAREMGMTAPGLYRYFSGLEDLLEALQVDCFEELTAHVRAAIAACPDHDLDGQTNAAARAFREWATQFPAEFTLLFGPESGHHSACPEAGPARDAGERFGAVFFSLFYRIWAEQRFVPPRPQTVPDGLKHSLAPFAEIASCGQDRQVPVEAIRVLASVWARLYGLICMEVFHQLDYVVRDMGPLFEAELREILELVGVEYRTPTCDHDSG
ncbi:TetR/AcrR family transcriptional regulator [Lipingzhangella sp. LS1_29]|uniref:TetR/AcrR family transcriptional regulator n=1 Tax=Lipingzhangella rawalii TaxID=2055835 RepID=A0ABU2H1W3_9ACTN|nr:TetR/AcrR family transcriptional regulator [Lipingzhangella rawalii]MDS1268854.1 TetR/AcrR family transcriptional regulator [Lipingzhangella rawalii]